MYKPVLLISVYLGFIHFIAMAAFPPFVAIMVAWFLILRNLNDDGRYSKYGFLIIFFDYLSFTFQVGEAGLQGLLTIVYIPLTILFVCWLFMFQAVRNEVFYFNRTIKGMNMDDQRKAIKALKSGNPEDFQEVAKYVDWNHVS